MLSKIIAEEAISQSEKLLKKHNKIAIITHISPDGDALGSSLGLYWFLKELEKEVVVVVPNPFPNFLRWLDGSSDIVIFTENRELAEQKIKEAELVFFLDFNTMNRIDGLKNIAIDAQGDKILIDHHPHPDIFCNVKISHPEVSSTSELIFRFICRMGLFPKITLPAAECIYAGMMTDTGNFSFNSQSPEIYSIIHELLLLGINKDEIYRKVYDTCSADKMKLMGYCLSEKMQIFPEQKAAIISLTLQELEQFNYQVGDSEGFVNMPLSIENIEISIFVRQDKDKIKISFRSQGDYPVNKMAEDFKGGGHLNAAGGESYYSMEKTLTLLEEAVLHREKYENME
ncbi:MAG: bifunctional oligoribonuclease/PAP phosphatase NrnA [Prevotellaceae bacterium]|jgi:phosphoesterase RecJ-like protein|nr:bifunctional oligoribonuclease/PAP phosphatase NrnA [Prevotellaceae bacterium]